MGLLLFFLCNLGSIHHHFIWLWAIWRAPRWLSVAWWMRTFYIRSSNWIIPNTAHRQSVEYLRVGRSLFCHAIFITRIPSPCWHSLCYTVIKVPEGTSDGPVPKTFKKFSHKKSTLMQHPWPGEEIRDWPGLKDLALSWWIGLWFFDVGEISELRLHTVTCLASLYVGKQHWTNNEPQNRIKWRWIIEPKLHRKGNLQQAQVYIISIVVPVFLHFNNYIEFFVQSL